MVLFGKLFEETYSHLVEFLVVVIWLVSNFSLSEVSCSFDYSVEGSKTCFPETFDEHTSSKISFFNHSMPCILSNNPWKVMQNLNFSICIPQILNQRILLIDSRNDIINFIYENQVFSINFNEHISFWKLEQWIAHFLVFISIFLDWSSNWLSLQTCRRH